MSGKEKGRYCQWTRRRKRTSRKFQIVSENVLVLHDKGHVIFFLEWLIILTGFSFFLILLDCRSGQRRRQWLDRWKNGLCGGGLPSLIRGTTS